MVGPRKVVEMMDNPLLIPKHCLDNMYPIVGAGFECLPSRVDAEGSIH